MHLNLRKRRLTPPSFGLRAGKAIRPEVIRSWFSLAVAEIYTLKNAGMDLDLAKLPNRGVYHVPGWVKQIKLHQIANGEFSLSYPEYKSAEEFLRVMQSVPEWDSDQAAPEDEDLVEKATDLLEPVLPQEPAPTMDPDTQAFKRAAVVKIDPDKKPFDFMSNRPVPRQKPAEPEKVEELLEAELVVATPSTPAPSHVTELMSAFEASQAAVSTLRHSVFDYRAQRLADDIAALTIAAVQSTKASSAEIVEEVKWRHVLLTNIGLKFAVSLCNPRVVKMALTQLQLFKRLYQLTGIRISDPLLASSNTLGDLYGNLCAAAKPQPTTVYSSIFIEGGKARVRAKQQASTQASSRRRADLGDLIRLGNVELRRVKANLKEKRTKTGLQKVYTYALHERGLLGA